MNGAAVASDQGRPRRIQTSFPEREENGLVLRMINNPKGYVPQISRSKFVFGVASADTARVGAQFLLASMPSKNKKSRTAKLLLLYRNTVPPSS